MENRTPAELIHLIRKLRWMGLDGEAARISAGGGGSQRGSVLTGPLETD